MSALTLTTFDSAVAFRERSGAFLGEQEAANNLILGLTSGLVDTSHHFPHPPYLAVVEADGAVVAAFLQTPPYRLIVSVTERPDALALVAGTIVSEGRILPGVTGPLAEARTFAARWQEMTGGLWTEARALRVYALSRVHSVTGVAGSLRRATNNDRELLTDWFIAFTDAAGLSDDRERVIASIDTRLEQTLGGIWLWEVDGAPVSLVGASGLTPHGIRIGPVYTPPAHRQRGYASAATAAVSQHLLDAGREFIFLFTDQANHTANHIYQTIGYEPIIDTVDIEFQAPASGA